MKGVTKKQRELLNFITEFIKNKHYSPSLSEIQHSFGYKSLSTVHQHIESLKKKGLLTNEKNFARSLTPTHTENPLIEVPIVGQFASSHPIELYTSPSDSLPLPKATTPPNAYILQVRGDGMIHEQIQNLDYLLIEATTQLLPGHVGLFSHSSGATLLKRYYPEEEFARLEPLHLTSYLSSEAYRHFELKIHGRLHTLMRHF